MFSGQPTCWTVGLVVSSRSRASACPSCARKAERRPSHLDVRASASSSALIDTATDPGSGLKLSWVT